MRKTKNTPDSWKAIRLDDVAEVVMGQSPHGKLVLDWDGTTEDNIGLPFIQGNSEFGTRNPNPVKWCVQPARIAQPGDLLLSVRAPVGDTNLANQQIAIGRGLAAIRFTAVSPKFGWHILNYTKEALRRLAQGSTFDAIGTTELRNLSLALPPPDEQKAIATVLDAVERAIEATESKIVCTDQFRDALLDALLTHGIPGWHSEWREVPRLGAIPASWTVERLADLLVLDQPGAWGDDPTPDEPGVRVLRASDLTRDGKIDPTRVVRRRLVAADRQRRLMKDGDLILERSGGGPGRPVGRVALITGLAPIYCSNFCQHLRVDTTRCDPRYVAGALWHRYQRKVTARLEQRTTGIRNLDYGGYLTIPFPLPSLEEQHLIAALLTAVDDLVERERQDIIALRSFRLSTLDTLLSGRTRISSVMLSLTES